MYDIALQDLPGNPPYCFKDHRKAKHPYLSRHGEIWVDKIKSSTLMYKFFCITNLICLMMNEAEKQKKGLVHEDDFFIVHDALMLITANETINWTINNVHLHRWFLPLILLQNGNPYAGHPVGNSPEFVPLDNSLNHDILHSLRMHIIFEMLHLI